MKGGDGLGIEIDRFTKRLLDELLPSFCQDPKRNFAVSGFKKESIKVAEVDARNFLRAIECGLVNDSGGGRYRCTQSKAFEQIFWEGGKLIHPRPITLWVEPIITIATIARLGLDFGWPAEVLGMQSKDGAFDFVVYGSGNMTGERIAGEVKKSRSELDELMLQLVAYGQAGATTPFSDHPKSINTFRKWAALLKCRAPLFWAVGPDDYTRPFQIEYGNDGTAIFAEVGIEQVSAAAHGLVT